MDMKNLCELHESWSISFGKSGEKLSFAWTSSERRAHEADTCADVLEDLNENE